MSENILNKAIEVYGEDAQIDQMIEEAAELIVALQHYKRGRITKDQVCEEVADVKIMSVQMEKIFGKLEVRKQEILKIKRLEERLIEHTNTTT